MTVKERKTRCIFLIINHSITVAIRFAFEKKKKLFQLLKWPFRGLQMRECREAEMGDLRGKSRMGMNETNPYLVALISVVAIFFESIINRTW